MAYRDLQKRNILWTLCLFTLLFCSLPEKTFAQTSSPVLLYQATAPTYNGNAPGGPTTNNRNPYGVEVYNCGDFTPPSISFSDDCSRFSTTINGEKWWQHVEPAAWSGYCDYWQAGFEAPYHSKDSRVTNGNRNGDVQICPATDGQRGPNPFINTTVQFVYNPTFCASGNQVVLAPRPDPSHAECNNVTLENIRANPANYSAKQRTCLMYVDDEVELRACRGANCTTRTIKLPANPSGVSTVKNQSVCNLFTQGAGTYDVTLRAYDTNRNLYGSSSFYLTWLSWVENPTISGNVFLDNNKNRIKDAGEPNYTGSNTITADGGNVTTRADGTYTITNVPAGTRTVRYTTLPAGYTLTTPLNGPPPSYQVIAGTGCNTNGATGASCAGGNISNLNFGITNSIPWIQAYDLDIRFDDGFTNVIPATAQYPPYAIAQSSGATTPGIVLSGNGTASFGQGQASSTNWIVGGTVYPEVFSSSNTSQLQSSYQSLLETSSLGNITPINLTSFSTCTNLANCTLPPDLSSGVYLANGNLTLNTFTSPTNRDYIFLINGNLTLNGNISIPNSSTALFSAARDILVPLNVGAPSNTFPLPSAQLQGFFTAGEDFVIQGINNCMTGPDKMLVMAGAVVVNAAGGAGGFVNQRDLCGGNATYPSFSIQARPDFILNAPPFLMKQNTSFREDAP